jgi:hypothetical protein
MAARKAAKYKIKAVTGTNAMTKGARKQCNDEVTSRTKVKAVEQVQSHTRKCKAYTKDAQVTRMTKGARKQCNDEVTSRTKVKAVEQYTKDAQVTRGNQS